MRIDQILPGWVYDPEVDERRLSPMLSIEPGSTLTAVGYCSGCDREVAAAWGATLRDDMGIHVISEAALCPTTGCDGDFEPYSPTETDEAHAEFRSRLFGD